MADRETVVSVNPSGLTAVARSIRIQQLLRDLWRNNDELDRIDTYGYLFETGDLFYRRRTPGPSDSRLMPFMPHTYQPNPRRVQVRTASIQKLSGDLSARTVSGPP